MRSFTGRPESRGRLAPQDRFAMPRRVLQVVLAGVLAVVPFAPSQAQTPSPSEYFGFELGADPFVAEFGVE